MQSFEGVWRFGNLETRSVQGFELSGALTAQDSKRTLHPETLTLNLTVEAPIVAATPKPPRAPTGTACRLKGLGVFLQRTNLEAQKVFLLCVAPAPLYVGMYVCV